MIQLPLSDTVLKAEIAITQQKFTVWTAKSASLAFFIPLLLALGSSTHMVIFHLAISTGHMPQQAETGSMMIFSIFDLQVPSSNVVIFKLKLSVGAYKWLHWTIFRVPLQLTRGDRRLAST